ncbi:MAG TPA: hypothetical protein VJ726_05780, partial [Candidatus Limnocylindria bacterium]|nr:hypothetical protein [Candidatus Limnocylindria bacterium]
SRCRRASWYDVAAWWAHTDTHGPAARYTATHEEAVAARARLTLGVLAQRAAVQPQLGSPAGASLSRNGPARSEAGQIALSKRARSAHYLFVRFGPAVSTLVRDVPRLALSPS